MKKFCSLKKLIFSFIILLCALKNLKIGKGKPVVSNKPG